MIGKMSFRMRSHPRSHVGDSEVPFGDGRSADVVISGNVN